MANNFNGLTQRVVDAASWALSGVVSRASQFYSDCKGVAVCAFKRVSSEPTLWNYVPGVRASIDQRQGNTYDVELMLDDSNPDLRRDDRRIVYRFSYEEGLGEAGPVAKSAYSFALSPAMRYREFNVVAGEKGVVLFVGYAGEDGVLQLHEIVTPFAAKNGCAIKDAPAEIAARPRVS